MIGRMLGAAQLKTATYEEVEHDQGAMVQALLVVIIVTIATIVGQLLGSTDDVDAVRALGIGIVRGVAGWALWALVIWIIGGAILKTEHTEANWGQIARGTGFAQTPGILNVLVFISAISLLIGLVTFVWTFVATLIAVRQTLDYTSTWRAFFVILFALIPVAILNIIVFFLTGGSINGAMS